MKLVFYSVVLNHHQACVADEFYRLLGADYAFVETINLGDTKGATEDYSQRPYLIRAWENTANYQRAMELARTAACCVFSGLDALPFQQERLRLGRLSFDMSERWLKRGWLNACSPAIFKMLWAYYREGWKQKPLYKLCCSAFAKDDQYRLGTYRDKCYKWGYFIHVDYPKVEASPDVSTSSSTPLLWCARYLKLKHPELPVLLARRLKEKGYRFTLNMYGSGEYEEATRRLVQKLQVDDVVQLKGNVPNAELMAAMQQHAIFLFTSDRNEGWGAVANESMSSGCALVGSEAIGSVPYLVQDGQTGCIFRAPRTDSTFGRPDAEALDSLTEKVEDLLQHPDKLLRIRQAGQEAVQQLWSPRHAAESLLQLIADLSNGKETSITEGPCSKG